MHNNKLSLSLLHKISSIILITEKLNKLAMEGSSIETNKTVQQVDFSSKIDQNNNILSSPKKFSQYLGGSPRSFLPEKIEEPKIYDLDSIFLCSQLWDPIFGSFYFLKYEIFLKTIELNYKIKLPFSAEGKDFNSRNVKEIFRVKDDKITLPNYLIWADFSLAEIITISCTDLTGDKLSIPEEFKNHFDYPNPYIFKIKIPSENEILNTSDPDIEWRMLLFILFNYGLKHINTQ